jgi:DNA replication protein DnaC
VKSPLPLPRLTNHQFDEIERLAKVKHLNLRECPGCGCAMEEIVPGCYEWPDKPTFRYMDKEHVCDCYEQDILRRRYLLANIPMHYWKLGPKDYFGDPQAWEITVKYLATWPHHRDIGRGIEFFSPQMGVGKTFLATYIARQLVRRGEPVYFTRFRSIMGLFDRPYETRKNEEERLYYTRVLLLDEVCPPLSTEQGKYFASEFENLIRTRIDDDRVTIITTNLQPNELSSYYPRTYNLLAAKQHRHEIQGNDVRRSGEILMLDEALAANGERRPLY